MNPLKERLARGELAASMTVRLVSSVEIVRIAKTAGFDAIYIDLEHSAFSIETTCQLSVMALEAGVPALVRVPARTPEYISRVLDGAALGAIDDIVAVEGVDMVLVGINDFLADLGRPGEYDHPKVREAYERAIRACKARGKHVGVGGLSSRPDLVQQYVAMGARFVSTGTDLAFLLAACAERAKQVRSLKIS